MRVVLVAVLVVAAGCGAGRRRTLESADVSPALAGSSAPFREIRLAWVETGVDRYDSFFREAAALQGALVLAERAAAGEVDSAPLLPVLEAVEARAAVALVAGAELLAGAGADFSDDEKKAMAIGPALHEAIGQVRDAAARAPVLLGRLRGQVGIGDEGHPGEDAPSYR